MPDTKPLRGITFSDLHLLAERQPLRHWDSYLNHWRDDFDLCVLNGDIFDFRWARVRDRETALHQARGWLEKLIGAQARAQFVILQGNHDALPAYRELLQELTDTHANLRWAEHWFRLGSKVFFHGDAPDRTGELHALRAYRAKHASHRPPRPLAHRLYASATRLGVTGLAPRALPWRLQIARADALLANALGPDYESVTDIYLGHTHVYFADRPFRGRLFHNGGAPLPRARFEPPQFAFTREAWSRSIADVETPE